MPRARDETEGLRVWQTANAQEIRRTESGTLLEEGEAVYYAHRYTKAYRTGAMHVQLNSPARSPSHIHIMKTIFTASLASALALGVSASPSISVAIGASKQVNGVDNLTVTTIVHNTGNETLKLLNHQQPALHF
ncbi:Peptidyl-Lys metalloendopeptidase [Ceratobasidium theobromae]|uniref:Peptidyl-Lys metalloendopeptidase n=1 Tax=Ceratobasidium theobromae TaxID=1582974 RepID=A0A5N5QAL1_9AGAM|nr:Peptidyl-Lys metalloendopeptidase [Ceratobasidium theobromae]